LAIFGLKNCCESISGWRSRPNHPFAQRRSVSLADAAQQSFVGLTREDYPDYHGYLATLFASVKNKPQVIEEHDGMTSVVSAVEAGTGVAVALEALVTLSAIE